MNLLTIRTGYVGGGWLRRLWLAVRYGILGFCRLSRDNKGLVLQLIDHLR